MTGMIACGREEGSPLSCAEKKVFSGEDADFDLLCPICILQHVGRGDIPVHHAAQGGRGEVIILCSRDSAFPLSSKPALERGGTIFRSKARQLYTFAESAVTCPDCLEKVSN